MLTVMDLLAMERV
ncbi:hypothetical protein KIPB_004329, partial [Kipferlia bialata]|eukprot:g4329.t1